MQEVSPRSKVKPVPHVKAVHSEQVSKLQHKYQQEVDLLDDIRVFVCEKAKIEKSSCQALLKLVQQLTQRKDSQPSSPESDDASSSAKDVSCVWRALLEESRRAAEARIAVLDSITAPISEGSKQARAQKTAIQRKVVDRLRQLQLEVAQSVLEMSEAHKNYSREEHEAHGLRVKADELEQRIKEKNTRIFQSMSSLQKNSSKLNAKRDDAEKRAVATRNAYVLHLAAANAHQARYFGKDLPELIELQDGDVYDRFQQYLSLVVDKEIQILSESRDRLSQIADDARLINRQVHLQRFASNNPVFRETTDFPFDAMDGDPVHRVMPTGEQAHEMNQEARKWATKLAKEQRIAADWTRSMEGLTEDADRDERMQAVRKAEAEKAKAEARLDALRAGGVNVDELLKSALADALAESIPVTPRETVKPTPPRASRDEVAESAPEATTPDSQPERDSDGPEEESPQPAVVLYDYPGTNEDELPIHAGQSVHIVAHSDNLGWLIARDAEGRTGLVPENYVQPVTEDMPPVWDGTGHAATDVVWPADSQSDDQTVPTDTHWPEDSTEAPAGDELSPQPPEESDMPEAAPVAWPEDTVEEADSLAEAASPPLQLQPGVMYARALYDYEANEENELTFYEGAVIAVMRKDDDVDDGFWMGEFNGRVGVFPSVLVEEMDDESSQTVPVLSPDDTPPSFSPPPFATGLEIKVTSPSPDPLEMS